MNALTVYSKPGVRGLRMQSKQKAE